MKKRTLKKPRIGWPLLPLPDENGRLHYPGLEKSVRESIRVILSTRPGEQLMRPGFGAGLERFLHEPNNLTTRSRIRDLITQSIARWERRIALVRVDVSETPEHPGVIRIDLAYRLNRTGKAQQMGITMEMEA